MGAVKIGQKIVPLAGFNYKIDLTFVLHTGSLYEA
jgi:hypothetical protein